MKQSCSYKVGAERQLQDSRDLTEDVHCLRTAAGNQDSTDRLAHYRLEGYLWFTNFQKSPQLKAIKTSFYIYPLIHLYIF